MIAIIEVSFVLCHRIDLEVEETGGPALSVDFHVESLSVVQALPFPLANGGGAGAGPGVRATCATAREDLPKPSSQQRISTNGTCRNRSWSFFEGSIKLELRVVEWEGSVRRQREMTCRVPQKEQQGL